MNAPKVPQRTTPGFASSIFLRALLESIAKRQFGRAEIGEVVAFFGNEPPTCVYCGTTPIQRWDHLRPISQGGDTILGNIVPACAKCDDSKRDLPYDIWARSSAPNSPHSRGVRDISKRLSKIRQYVAKYAYVPRTPDERLNSDELRQFEGLRVDLQKLRADFDEFVSAFRHSRSRS